MRPSWCRPAACARREGAAMEMTSARQSLPPAARHPAGAGPGGGLPDGGLPLWPPVLWLAVPAFLAGGDAQRFVAPRQWQVQPVGPPCHSARRPHSAAPLVAAVRAVVRGVRLPLGHHAADLPAAAGPGLGQSAGRHTHAQPGALQPGGRGQSRSAGPAQRDPPPHPPSRPAQRPGTDAAALAHRVDHHLERVRAAGPWLRR